VTDLGTARTLYVYAGFTASLASAPAATLPPPRHPRRLAGRRIGPPAPARRGASLTGDDCFTRFPTWRGPNQPPLDQGEPKHRPRLAWRRANGGVALRVAQASLTVCYHTVVAHRGACQTHRAHRGPKPWVRPPNRPCQSRWALPVQESRGLFEACLMPNPWGPAWSSPNLRDVERTPYGRPAFGPAGTQASD
jgi:hypothetical protein